MGIFDRFTSRDELLKAFESAIKSQIVKQEGKDGAEVEVEEFYIDNDAAGEAAEWKSKFNAEVESSKKYRKRAQEVESQLAELRKVEIPLHRFFVRSPF